MDSARFMEKSAKRSNAEPTPPPTAPLKASSLDKAFVCPKGDTGKTPDVDCILKKFEAAERSPAPKASRAISELRSMILARIPCTPSSEAIHPSIGFSMFRELLSRQESVFKRHMALSAEAEP